MSAAVGRLDRLEEWLAPFRILFTRPTWRRVLVLATGAILTTHRRTVAAALRVTGRGEDAGFSRYHDVLSRSRWSALAAARLLLVRLVATFVPAGLVVIGLDDTIERRWGAKIAARGIYRDPVRSSHGHFVVAIRWKPLRSMVRVAIRRDGCQSFAGLMMRFAAALRRAAMRLRATWIGRTSSSSGS